MRTEAELGATNTGTDGKPGAATTSNDQEFLLHLYDKLWENINQKESAVWTFLAVYGAVLAVALGSEAFDSLGSYGVLAVLLLTYWAMHIVINADWWSIRNRLMVGRIEKRFPAACDKVIPSFYIGPRYQNETLNVVSIVIFFLIAYILYFKTLLDLAGPGKLDNWMTLLQTVVLYGVFSTMSLLNLRRDELHLREYYKTYTDLYAQDADFNEHLAQKEKEDRNRLKRRYWFLAVCLLLALPLYALLLYSAGLETQFVVGAAIALAIAVILFLCASVAYYRWNIVSRQEDRYLVLKDILSRLAAVLFLVSCGLLITSGHRLPIFRPAPSAATSQQELQGLEKSLQELQKKVEAIRKKSATPGATR